jgi:hypothetical protein
MPLNCWEFKKCGREPNGAKAKELGVCPAAIAKKVDGLNHGKNGGRVCWAVAGTFCNDEVQGTFAKKYETCVDCDFFRLVAIEEGPNLAGPKEIISKLKS